MTDCTWPGKDPLYLAYHEKEWGLPVTDDQTMFAFLVLETFQAGLSWITILRKRENFFKAFHGFNAHAMANMQESDVERLLLDPGIIRHRAKIHAAINNARCFLTLQQSHGSFAAWWWHFVGFAPIINHPKPGTPPIAKTPISDAISKALKKHGFKFVGSTTVYAHMQATGMVNDHLSTCSAKDIHLQEGLEENLNRLKLIWASGPQTP